MNRSSKQLARVFQYPLWALSFAVLVFFICGALAVYRGDTQVQAAAGVNEQFNYQGRLLTNAGATVPDGNYNMRFKLYQGGDGVAGGGDETLEWTETRLNSASQGVQVKNGYFSVYLGSVTPFGTSVDWNDDTLWLSMEVTTDGTIVNPSPTWNGEMTPFKRLGASPYALNTKYLGGLTASQFVQLAQGVQADTTTVSSIFLNKTGASGNILQFQKNGSDVLALDNSGLLTASGGLTANGAVNINQFNVGSVTNIGNGTGADITIGSGSGSLINLGSSDGNLDISSETSISNFLTVASSSASALSVGRNGAINPALQVNASTASSATGLSIASKAAGAGVTLSAISSGTDEDLSIDAKGSGVLNIGNNSTGNVLIAGGSGSTGCTVTNSTGAFACTAGLSGSNFSGSSSGTNTGDQTSVTGNAGTATALQTARTINGVSFNGTADITITAAADAGTLTGTTLAAGVTASSLTSLGTLTGLSVSGTTTLTSTSASALAVGRNGATNPALQIDASTASSATGLSIASKAAGAGVIVTAISSGTNEDLSIDAKGSGLLNIGNNSTGNVLLAGGSSDTGCTVTNSTGAFACTAGLSGTTGGFSSTISASNFSGSSSGTNTGDQTSVTGNAGTATALQTARNINGVSFNGTADITVTAAAGTLTGATLASGVTASSLTSLGTLTGLTVVGTANINATGSAVTTIGALTSTDLVLRDANWNITGAGAATFASVSSATGTFSGAIAANGGITFNNSTDTLGAYTLAGTVNANNNILTNIGNSGTDFVASTGALTLAGVLTANGGVTVAAGQNFAMTIGAGTHTQAFSGTTTIASTITADNLISGKGLSISSSSTALTTGSLLDVTMSGGANGATGYVANISNTSAASAAGGLFISNNGTGTGMSFRVDDVTNDTTPFVIDGSGNVGIGTTSPSGPLTVFPIQYSTGSASQSGNIVTGSGTTFTAAMVGAQLVYANGVSAGRITVFTSATQITVSTSQTVSSQAYTITSGLQVASTGNIGINTTSPTASLQIIGQQVIGAGSPFMEGVVAGFTGLTINKENGYAAQAFQVASATAAESGVFFGSRSRGTLTAPTTTSSGDMLFMIAATGYTTSNTPANLSYPSTISSLSFVQDAASTSTAAPAAIVFNTLGSERMRITSDGLVSVGVQTTSQFGVTGNSNADNLNQYVAQINEVSNAAGSEVLMIRGGQTSYTAPSTLITFRRYDGTNIGSVQQNSSSSVAFNTTSDARLKENIIDSSLGLDIINQIKVREYSYISDGNHTMQQGMIAQELYDVYGQAVTVGGDDVNKSPWAIDYGKLTPLLVKGMQDLDVKHENLQTAFDAHMAGLEQQAESGSDNASDSDIAQLTSDLAELGDRVTNLENQVGQLGAGFANGGIVTGDAEFQASVMFAANVTFQSDTTFNGTIALNDDVRGVDVTIPADGNSTKVITFAQAQPDSKYAVQCTPGWNTNCFVTNKTKDGFTLNFTAPVTDTTLDWMLIR